MQEPNNGSASSSSANDTKLWYLGMMKPWKRFHLDSIEYLLSQEFKDNCDYETDALDLLYAPHDSALTDPTPLSNDDGTERIADYFEKEFLDAVNRIYDGMLAKLLFHRDPMDDNVPVRTLLGKACDEDLGNSDRRWDPRFVIRTVSEDGEEESKLLGHVEYLGGKEDVLTKAIKNSNKTTWGSLRCMLGDVAQWMFMGSMRYAFLLTGDEIMFLKLDIVSHMLIVHERKGPILGPTVITTYPTITYSKPYKFTSELGVDKGPMTVRLVFLYFLHLATMGDYKVEEDTETSLRFLVKWKRGENYRDPGFAFMLEPGFSPWRAD